MSDKQILVYGDLRSEQFLGYSLNVLGKARELSQNMGAAVVMLDNGENDCIKARTAAQTCIENGADYVYILRHPSLTDPKADEYDPYSQAEQR